MKAGWTERPLGEVIELVSGQHVDAKDYNTDRRGVGYLTGPSDFGAVHPVVSKWTEKPKRFAKAGDILLTVKGSGVGKTNLLVAEQVAISRQIMAVRAKGINARFLHLLLQSLGAHFASLANGAAIPGISRTDVTDYHFPHPPLEEQRRIVAVLDEAFEALARARAHAEANLKNARELFESYAASVFEPHEETTASTTVGAVCRIQSGAGFPLRYQGGKSGDFPFYKVSDMNLPGNEWGLQVANNYVSDAVRQELGAKVFPEGAIVFPKVGGAIATNKKRVVEAAGCVDNNVMGLIPNERLIVREYLHEWLRAFDIYEFSNKANPPSITQTTVAGWPLRVPPKDEQMQVVAVAQLLRELTESLVRSYRDRMQDVDDLRQTLLQKAFAGELT